MAPYIKRKILRKIQRNNSHQNTILLNAFVFLDIKEDLPSTTREIIPLGSLTFPPKQVGSYLEHWRSIEPARLDILEGTGEVYLDEANLENIFHLSARHQPRLVSGKER